MRRHSVARPGTASKLPRQFLEIRPTQIEEKNTRSPTLDCSRSTSSTFELETFCTAIVTDGRLSACPIAKRGSSSVPAAAPPDFRMVRRVSLLMTIPLPFVIWLFGETERGEMRSTFADVVVIAQLEDQPRIGGEPSQ